MNSLPRTLALTISACVFCSALSLKAADEPSTAPKPASKSTAATVAPTESAVTANAPTVPPGSPAVSADNRNPPPDDPPIVLEPIVTTESTQLSFQFSIRVARSRPDNQLIAMYVDRVTPRSTADEAGLEPGSMILSIDGKSVTQYEASFRSGSELSNILVGRREGAEVTLVVIPPDETKSKKIVVTRRTRSQVRIW